MDNTNKAQPTHPTAPTGAAPAPKKKGSGGKLLAIGCLTPLLGLGLLLGLSAILRSANSDFVDAEAVCDEKWPQGAPPQLSEPPQVAGYGRDASDKKWTYSFGNKLPRSFEKADTFASSDFIYCRGEPKSVAIQSCPYGAGDGPPIATYTRKQWQLPVRVLDAKNETTLFDGAIVGGEPEACPASVGGGGGGGGGIGIKVLGIPVASVGGTEAGGPAAKDTTLNGPSVTRTDIDKQLAFLVKK